MSRVQFASLKDEAFGIMSSHSTLLCSHNFCFPRFLGITCLLAKLLQLGLIFVIPRSVTHQAPLFMGFSRQEYWSGLPCSPPGDLPDPENEPASLMSPTLAGGFFITSTTWEALLGMHKESTLIQI